MIRLAVIDYNASRQSGLALYRAIQQAGIAEVVIVAPSRWEDFGITYTMEEIADRPEIIPLDVYFSGKQHRVLFKGLAECLRRIDPDLILCNAEPENFLAFQVEHARRRLRRSVPLALISWRNID